MVTSTDQPTDRPTDQPTDQPGEYRAICLFRKLENRKKAEICNYKYEYEYKYNYSETQLHNSTVKSNGVGWEVHQGLSLVD